MVNNNFAIILAAGDGKRLGSKTPKAFVKYKGKEIYKYSLAAFCSIKQFKKIVLVVPKGYEKTASIADKRVIVVTGGKTRNESFEDGVAALVQYIKYSDKILIHDAARINVKKQDILKLIKAKGYCGTLCYKGPKNKSDLRVKNYNIQTPQFIVFWLYLLCNEVNVKGKDLFTYLNLEFESNNLIQSSNKSKNFKITYKADLNK